MPLLVDGYNLLGRLRKLEEHFEPLDAAGLCRLLSRYLAATRGHGTICFDGTGPRDKSAFLGLGSLEVHFCGSHEEADDQIERRIADCSAPRRLVVVSDDRRVRAAAKRRRAVSVRCDDFMAEVVERLSRRPAAREPSAKRHGVSDAETERWMEVFGFKTGTGSGGSK